MVAVVLAKLAKLVVILKLGLRNISKRITSFIFLNIYTPPQHALTHIILFVLKQLIKLTLNSTSKLKKPQQNLKPTTKSSSSHHFTIASLPLCSFLSLFLFCVSFSSIIFITSDANYRHLLLS